LKEIFCERGEGPKGGRQEKGTLGEENERLRIIVTCEEEYLVETSKGDVGESKPITLEDIRLHHEVD